MAAITVEHAERDDSPQTRREGLQFVATRTLQCAWEDRKKLEAELIAWPGHLYPHATNMQARVHSVAVKPFGKQAADEDGLPVYIDAVLTVEYRTPGAYTARSISGTADSVSGSQIYSDVKYVESIEPAIDNVVLDHSRFLWEDYTKLEPAEAPSLALPSWEYSFHVLNGTFIPPVAQEATGKVNSGALTTRLGHLFFKPETLLYLGPSVSRTMEPGQSGSRLDILHRFLFKPTGWNHYARSAAPTGMEKFQRIVLIDAEDTPYNTYELINLFNITFG